MKARIATGEIFDIEGVSLRLNGKVLSTFGIDEVEVLMPDLTPDYWTRLEHQYAGMAMQALLSSETMMVVLSRRDNGTMEEEVAREAFDYAHALVEKLKEKEERK